MSQEQVVKTPTDSDIPPHRYTAARAGRIERSWQDRWAEEGTFAAPNPVGELAEGFAERAAERPKLFVNDMFPYPSGEGLHVGHPLGYIGTDVYSRYMRMRGHNVLHTMGFDAFGLPAEQFAVQTGQHPRATTEQNIVAIRRQLRRLGLDHDTRRSVATMDPQYYKWTQWIFKQIFSSYYDEAADRARPIDDLVAEFDAGTREPAAGNNPYGLRWPELDAQQRNSVVDAHRLAYLNEAPVNWCPGLGTVLSNEEVTADGRSERGNFPVFRRPLKQWKLRITAYAERLLSDLDALEWPESIKLMQRNWIGRSIGATIAFPTDRGLSIEVFTTRPDTLFGATYVVLAPEHPLVKGLTTADWPEATAESWRGVGGRPPEAVAAYQQLASRRSELERQTDQRVKSGVFLGSFATNMATGQRIPVFIADYVLTGYGTGAIMAVPGQDERDWEFAGAYDLPIVRTVAPPSGFEGKAFTGEGPAINSANDSLDLNGLGVADSKAAMITWLVDAGHGQARTTYRLRDWLFSRQRYWGEPFPIVYPVDGVDIDRPIVVPDEALPVLLPDVEDYSPRTFADDDVTSEPEAPLARATEWLTVELDLGDGVKTYRRETNTMPNWAGSCWYELRYLDPHNDDVFCDPVIEKYWMGPREDGDPGGVDLYVGGAEHAVLHLLYARFWHKVLFDLGHVSSSEPFRRLVNQGMLQAPAYTDARGMYVDASRVESRQDGFYYDDAAVRQEFGKIGKSLKNMITPDDMFADYGADTFRLYEMFTGPLDQSRPWDPKAVIGMLRLLQRLWRLVIDEQTGSVRVGNAPVDAGSLPVLNRVIEGVREGMDSLRFNIAIARITELVNHVTQSYADRPTPRELAEPLVLMIAPLAPHIAEELWSKLGHPESLARTNFPVADSRFLVDDTVQIAVQVNGRLRGSVAVPADADAAAMEAAARREPNVIAHLDGAQIRRVIAVPGKLVNFVLG
ncbi:MAG: leucine--tRNA ligase [Geodermatophilaceae bacterium]|nr:leucine--tRNA ligase [Geodermatophilaceae bacterium]